MDDKDFVFVNKPLTKEEESSFSLFLKEHKAKTKATKTRKAATPYISLPAGVLALFLQ